MLAAISEDFDLEYFALIDGYVNQSHVLKMLSKLLKRGKNALLFFYVASYFNCIAVNEFASRLFTEGIEVNVPY